MSEQIAPAAVAPIATTDRNMPPSLVAIGKTRSNSYAKKKVFDSLLTTALLRWANEHHRSAPFINYGDCWRHVAARRFRGVGLGDQFKDAVMAKLMEYIDREDAAAAEKAYNMSTESESDSSSSSDDDADMPPAAPIPPEAVAAAAAASRAAAATTIYRLTPAGPIRVKTTRPPRTTMARKPFVIHTGLADGAVNRTQARAPVRGNAVRGGAPIIPPHVVAAAALAPDPARTLADATVAGAAAAAAATRIYGPANPSAITATATVAAAAVVAGAAAAAAARPVVHRPINAGDALPDGVPIDVIERMFASKEAESKGALCPICMEHRSSLVRMNHGCTHAICTSCCERFTSMNILKDGVKCTGCASSGGSLYVDPRLVFDGKIDTFRKASFASFQIPKLQGELDSLEPKLTEPKGGICPLCGTLSPSGLSALRRCLNPRCCAEFCVNCGASLAGGADARKRHVTGACLEMAVETKVLADKPGMTPCAKCGTPLFHAKGHGCHHVKCSSCAFEMCHCCGKPWTPSRSCGCMLFCAVGVKCRCADECVECKEGTKPCVHCTGSCQSCKLRMAKTRKQ